MKPRYDVRTKQITTAMGDHEFALWSDGHLIVTRYSPISDAEAEAEIAFWRSRREEAADPAKQAKERFAAAEKQRRQA